MPPKKTTKKEIQIKKNKRRLKKEEEKKEDIAKPEAEEAKEIQKISVQLVRGMRDILPKEQKYWRFIREQAQNTADTFSFNCLETPVVEYTKLYERPLGATSDVVSKEMYSFTDRSRDRVSLRPEWTAGVVRAYLEHGMQSLPQPVRLMSIGPIFRYERPQAGRHRQHHQLNFEIIGDPGPVSDALIILLTHHFYRGLGLQVQFQINSLGCPGDREIYIEQLVNFLKPSKRELCEDCQARFVKNPLRILDCKQKTCREIVKRAPQLVDNLCEECREHLMSVLEYLDEADILYALNPLIVRGFDYYTRTIFEVVLFDKEQKEIKTESEGEVESEGQEGPVKESIAGGGRYDNLVEMFGGRHTPACGVGIGLERAIKALRVNEIKPKEFWIPDAFLAQLGETARKSAFGLLLELQKHGFKVIESFTKGALRDQLGIASESKVPFTVILGHKEVVDETAIIRDMISGVQEVVDRKKLVSELGKRLEAYKKEKEAEIDKGVEKTVE